MEDIFDCDDFNEIIKATKGAQIVQSETVSNESRYLYSNGVFIIFYRKAVYEVQYGRNQLVRTDIKINIIKP